MPLLTFNHPELATRLNDPATTLVVCLCADWCGTCRDYAPRFTELAARLPPDHILVWLDIEDHAELLDDEDVENFPTLWVEADGRLRFYGPMLPHIGQLEDILQRLREGRYGGGAKGPDLRGALIAVNG